jgi:hypothetical protein
MDVPDLSDAPAPWQDSSVGRYDAVPHRGELLHRLAMASLLLGAGTLLTCGATDVIAGMLSLFVLRASRADLKGMDQGTVEPLGRHRTMEARSLAWAALFVAVAMCGMLLLLIAPQLPYCCRFLLHDPQGFIRQHLQWQPMYDK